MQADDLDSLFLLPLSQQALEELEELQNQLQDIPYDDDATDKWVPIWGQRLYFAMVLLRGFQVHRCTPGLQSHLQI